MEFTRHAVELGPRPSGSEANRQLQAYILAQLKTCKCEVTQAQYKKLTGSNPSASEDPRHPVGRLSWNAADAFCRLLSQKLGRNL